MLVKNSSTRLFRFNRTLKTTMWRYFTAKNTRKYLDVLQDLVHGYNHIYHESIKMAPMQATVENTLQVFQNLYGAVPVRYSEKLKMNFKRGDFVQISKVRVYRLKDYDGEPINVAPDKIYAVERVLDERVVREVKQKFVKWRNWPEKFNSWVRTDDLVNI
ncbi:hypothetical protein F2P81_001379 [Scophthalmus maximus]|uniref:Chromo domain-containing protein n=1 Tax=Scophthalmus maximus TaxID=52904 RepID=A0A6A4TJQ9_SCOMX|nr:hypothetical protein F2P81_001379 [Scophthalmus maximus]